MEQAPQAFKVRVTHSRGKYAPKVYDVTAKDPLTAYDQAFDLYIQENKRSLLVK